MQIKYIDTKPQEDTDSEDSFEKYIANTDIPFNII